ncbi:MarR family winged helix-turn-helix transcriptional regulator [Rathayibacter soli]|uniref:MarR family winged helix-turn-helix transcriptional regulator n=1 Tax=Rathayibacter soli TaxID=3144168 RepID=UPI0027E50517|nr:MarR family transcriptional regulator [Glaciibacter superstes]
MRTSSIPPYRFGDLLALARQSWVKQLAGALAEAGYPDYRRSDALAMRLLLRRPLPIGRLGEALGVTRQAAKKVATGLEGRGYATAERDARDGRQTNIALTSRGRDFAHAIVGVIDQLDAALAARVSPDQLTAADTVLRAVLGDEHSRALARLVAPPHDGR